MPGNPCCEQQCLHLGYAFLYLEKTDEAIAVLELNTGEYPESWSTWGSLGEAYTCDAFNP